MEGEGLRDRAPEFEAEEAEILGVSYDPPEENRAFAEKHGFPFRLLSDVDREVAADYGTRRPDGHERAAVPRRFTYLIDPEGRVAKSYVVRDVGSHAPEVLGDLRRLRSRAAG